MRIGFVSADGGRRFHGLLLAVLATTFLVRGSVSTWAQTALSHGNPGILDKPKAKAKLMEHYRAKLEVQDDAEWNIIEARIENVFQAQRDLQAALQVTQYRNHSGKSSEKGSPSGGLNASARSAEGDVESDIRALQKLVATHAPAKEIKPQLARVRDILKTKQDKLTNTREDLRAVLSARQEAIAVLNGLLR